MTLSQKDIKIKNKLSFYEINFPGGEYEEVED